MTQDAASDARPFWAATPARTLRRGHCWIAGERVTRPYPVVLVHGGGFQGTA